MSILGQAYGDGTTTHDLADRICGVRDENANGIALLGSIAGVALQILAVGDDTNISIRNVPKGTGVFLTNGVAFEKVTATTITTAGAVTYTAAQLKAGLILRDPNGAARADLVPTGALLAAAIPGVAVGTSFEFTIRNDADAAETITLTTALTGSTMSGTMTIAQNQMKRFRVVFDSTTAYTVYSLGAVTF